MYYLFGLKDGWGKLEWVFFYDYVWSFVSVLKIKSIIFSWEYWLYSVVQKLVYVSYAFDEWFCVEIS